MRRADLRRMLKRTSPQEALNQLLDAVHAEPLPCEMVAIEESIGRVLAKDMTSELNIPRYNKTYIDGYAVRSEDAIGASVRKPVMLQIVGKLFPTDYPTKIEISRGETVYVSCGAPIPGGAYAAIKVEETRLHEGKIEICRVVEAGEGIIPAGDDVKKGSLILEKGRILRPQDIGLLAAVQMTKVEVVKRPKVSIISVGDELIELSKEDPTKIVNNYALIVSSLASELGAIPLMLGIVPDDLVKIKEKVSEAIEKADIVVTIGGCSVGVKDFVPDAINALGEPGVLVHGILIKPGAVSGFGVVKGKPIIMLPGHIVSCAVGFYLFVAPMISLYSGLGKEAPLPSIRGKIDRDIEAGPRFTFLRTHVRRVDGTFIAEPVQGGSNSLSTLVKANGFTIIPPRKELKKGEEVSIILFSKQEFAQFSTQ